MNMLLAFAPFIAFAVVDRVAGARDGLIAGAVVSLALVVRELVRGRSAKVLELGSVLLFGGLAGYALAANPGWSVVGVRLCVDVGLLVIVLGSLAVRKPFTIQYARESVPREHWNSPTFVRTNVVITAVWALAFALLVAADVVMLYAPDVPHQVGVAVTVLALIGAFRFTEWYSDRAGTL